jgi:hypothetical protein
MHLTALIVGLWAYGSGLARTAYQWTSYELQYFA